MTIYRKILNNSICYPCHFSAVLRDILHGLLQTDVTRRLGAMHRGAADIKVLQHYYTFLYAINLPMFDQHVL